MKKPSQKKFDKWSENIMNEFDFDRVHKTMKCLNWEWRNEGVPDIPKIIENARYVMSRAYETESGIVSTGGFEARVTKYGISLKFVLTDWDTYE